MFPPMSPHTERARIANERRTLDSDRPAQPMRRTWTVRYLSIQIRIPVLRRAPQPAAPPTGCTHMAPERG